jgi:hypothetical protein
VWLRELLPIPFKFNEDRNKTSGANKSAFVLLSREEKRLTVVAIRHAPNGQDLFEFKGRWKAGVPDSKIIFSSSDHAYSGSVTDCHAAFTKHIKPQVYESWEIIESDLDQEQSESGSEAASGDEDNAEEDGSSINDARKSREESVVGKGKGRADTSTGQFPRIVSNGN